MSALSGIASMVQGVEKLKEGGWFKWKKAMGMVFLYAELEGIESGKKPEDVDELKKWNAMDKKLTALVYNAVASEFQYLVEDERTASGAFGKLKEHFERTSMSARINARLALYDIKHDPSQPISVFFHALNTAKSTLTSLGVNIAEEELKDILLMRLDDSYASLRVSILARETEPSLSAIKSLLLSQSASVDIKTEAEFGFSARSKRPSGSNSDPIDNKGFRWCDPTAVGVCHRCGRPGHPAARCMYDMPRHVKDWLSSRPLRSTSSSSSPPAHQAHSARDLVAPSCPNCGLDLTVEHAKFAHSSNVYGATSRGFQPPPDDDDYVPYAGDFHSGGGTELGGGYDSDDEEVTRAELAALVMQSGHGALPRI